MQENNASIFPGLCVPANSAHGETNKNPSYTSDSTGLSMVNMVNVKARGNIAAKRRKPVLSEKNMALGHQICKVASELLFIPKDSSSQM